MEVESYYRSPQQQKQQQRGSAPPNPPLPERFSTVGGPRVEKSTSVSSSANASLDASLDSSSLHPGGNGGQSIVSTSTSGTRRGASRFDPTTAVFAFLTTSLGDSLVVTAGDILAARTQAALSPLARLTPSDLLHILLPLADDAGMLPRSAYLRFVKHAVDQVAQSVYERAVSLLNSSRSGSGSAASGGDVISQARAAMQCATFDPLQLARRVGRRCVHAIADAYRSQRSGLWLRRRWRLRKR
jgi:hypothetical protein